MKKNHLLVVICTMLCFSYQACKTKQIKKRKFMALAPAPTTIKSFKEIAIQYNEDTTELFNKLAPAERIFTYYLFRASLPGNRIAADQQHRHGLAVINLFNTIYKNKDKLTEHKSLFDQNNINLDTFLSDTQTFLVYLWTNHGQYFQREQANQKRTPKRIGLHSITPQSLTLALETLKIESPKKTIAELETTIFDTQTEKTGTVPNNIAQSAVNMYEKGFTEEDYQKLPEAERNKINAYFYLDKTNGKRIPKSIAYSSQGKYNQELSVASYWLEKAYEHAQKYPQYFDNHLITSLDFLIQFVQTGNEEFFKKHSIEWLKSSSRLDYNFGFIETYDDPKSQRGFFQAEVTIKSVNIDKLNKLLPDIEKALPIPVQYRRDALGSVPNASINSKVFGYGGLGPMHVTAAYCLPNYSEIRSEHGSKQIIYPSSKSLMTKLNPQLDRKLFCLAKQAAWLDKHDPNRKLSNDIWDAQCILHETLGHGSGKLAKHTFKEGETLTIGGVEHNVGETIPVTSKNVTELLAGYENTIEELRAEIIALYVSTHHLDQLVSCGLMTSWKNKISDKEVIEQLILGMTGTGLRRYLQQSDDAQEIAGAHAQANCTIMYYLIDHGGITLKDEIVDVKGTNHTVVGIEIIDFDKTQKLIQELMIEVQRIKSTGDGLGAKKLIETYGKTLRHPQYLKALKENQKAIVGDIKCSAYIFPQFIPQIENGDLVDVSAQWPDSIFTQYEHYENIMLSTTL